MAKRLSWYKERKNTFQSHLNVNKPTGASDGSPICKELRPTRSAPKPPFVDDLIQF